MFSVLSLLIITPVVAFYLLLDWEQRGRDRRWLDSVAAPRHGARLARDIDAAIAGFVRGQAVICLILAAFYAIGLTLTGLNFGFLIGLMTGLLSFIPSSARRPGSWSPRSSPSRSSGRTGRRSRWWSACF